MDNFSLVIEEEEKYFCCGNCINYITFSRSCGKTHKPVTADCYCRDGWEFDGMSSTERESEAFEQNNC